MRRDSVTLVVAAHPDDEILGAGIWMRRRNPGNMHIVHLTDGSPRDLKEAARLGFSSRQAYASARRRELFEALKLLGIAPSHCVECRVADQEAFLNLALIIDRLDALVRRVHPHRIITHAYEGGHPDHDSAAFAVAMLRNRNPDFDHVEFPLYHSGSDGRMITGEFLGGAGSVRQQMLRLTPRERDLKSAMLACFQTQQEILSQFDLEYERFRAAPVYDFTLPPHPGPLLYERWGWPIRGAAWRKQVSRLLNGPCTGRAAALPRHPSLLLESRAGIARRCVTQGMDRETQA